MEMHFAVHSQHTRPSVILNHLIKEYFLTQQAQFCFAFQNSADWLEMHALKREGSAILSPYCSKVHANLKMTVLLRHVQYWA